MTFRIIADDYGLSPGVSEAIRTLLDAGRLSGTSCMTIFPDWPEQAARLAPGSCAGLHLTLTDQPALTGASRLAPEGRLPALGGLVAGLAARRMAEADVHDELDAQHARFVAELGRQPDFFDGHQHVHFLPAVRRWLKMRFERDGEVAGRFVRAAPGLALGLGTAARKQAVIAALAGGFDAAMRRARVPLSGPLTGIYDWRARQAFAGVLSNAVARGGPQLFMCHPGFPDEVLAGRDPFLAQRKVEYDALMASKAVVGALGAGAA